MERSRFIDDGGTRPRRRGLMLASAALLAGMVLATTVRHPSGGDQASERVPGTRVRANASASPAGVTSAAPAFSGPARTEHGVAAGFARTADGAVAAAVSFVCTGQALLDMDPLAAEEAVRQMAAAATADHQVADTLAKLRTARNTLAPGSGPIVYRQAAVAWRVESFTPDRARIGIWNVGVLAREGIAPPQAGWAISTFELGWERDDWKVIDERIAPGPAPILDDSAAPATAAQLIASLRDFTHAGAPR